jgi:hypothetical protein
MRPVLLALLSCAAIQAAILSDCRANDVSLTAEVAGPMDKGQPIGLIHLTLHNLTKDQTFIINALGNYGFGASVYYLETDRKRTLLWSFPYPPSNQPIEQSIAPMELKPGDAEIASLQLTQNQVDLAKGKEVICVVTFQNHIGTIHDNTVKVWKVESPPKIFWN